MTKGKIIYKKEMKSSPYEKVFFIAQGIFVTVFPIYFLIFVGPVYSVLALPAVMYIILYITFTEFLSNDFIVYENGFSPPFGVPITNIIFDKEYFIYFDDVYKIEEKDSNFPNKCLVITLNNNKIFRIFSQDVSQDGMDTLLSNYNKN